jgi:hypothetical protein
MVYIFKYALLEKRPWKAELIEISNDLKVIHGKSY